MRISQDSSVNIAPSYWLDGKGSTSDMDKKLFFTPQHPDWL
jgi:hypothetical protein